MKHQLRNQLLGAGVLTALAVIFLPLIIEEKPPTVKIETVFPEPPKEQYNTPDIPAEIAFKPFEKPVIAEIQPVLEETETAISKQPKIKKQTPPPLPKPVVDKLFEQATPKKIEGLNAWVLQVGSFSNKQNATRLVKKLKKYRLEVFMEKIETSKRTLYRVRVGPEIKKSSMQKIQKRVQKITKIKGRVMHYP